MLRIALLAVAALAIAAGTAGAHPARASGPCKPKLFKIKGHQAATPCGPASAVLRYGGKTYKYRGGTCQSVKGNSWLELDLGTVVAGLANNGGYPAFTLTVGPNKLVAGLHTYGKPHLMVISLKLKASSPQRGTFSGGQIVLGGRGTVSGSWNCGGTILSLPG
jgi:hypothetical protein